MIREEDAYEKEKNDKSSEDEDDSEDNEEEEKQRQEEINIIKNSETYKIFEKKWKKFEDKCKENGILVRSEFTCCDTCGNYEISDEKKKEKDKKYHAYIFYHDQEAERIYEMCKEGKKEIEVHLAWNYFNDKNGSDIDCTKLAKNIHDYALSTNCDLEYKDISRKLVLKIKID